MSVGRIASRVVATATATETVRTVARRMNEEDVGTLVVLGGESFQEPVGIVTDRDLVTRCLAAGLDPEETAIATVMSTPAQTVDEDTPIEQALNRMARLGTRRLVVTAKGGHVAGIVSLDDVMELLVDEAQAIGRLLARQGTQIPT